jgi:ATP-binding cassette subfamily B protein
MSGVVFQDFNLFHTRISETIRVYNHTLHNHNRVVESAKAVEIEEYVYSLPNQFDTKIGTFYEGGIKLSGGQQQKVAIAGLIYRDAKFVILDEPTSDLSPTAEQKIIEQYKNISEGKTGLIIFHRYKALRLVDRIMVLEEGVIIEQGTHSELMVLDGSYAVLFRAAQLQTD